MTLVRVSGTCPRQERAFPASLDPTRLNGAIMKTLIYGDRLRQARVLRDVRSGDLAGAAGVTAPTLTKWEQADSLSIEPVALANICRTLQFPEDFFRTRPAPPLNEQDLRFRAPKSTLKREKERLIQFARMAEEVFRWVDSKQQLPPLILPRLKPDHELRAAAAVAREALGLPVDKPIGQLTHAVERAGVPIIRQPVPKDAEPGTNVDKHLGYTAWTGEFWERPIIITRGVPSWERTRWTIAHELGHALLHRSEMVVDREAAEIVANEFANELLAPIDVVTLDLPKVVTLFALIEVKNKWGLSIGALIKHLHSAKVISDDRRDSLQAQLYTRRNPETGTTFGVYEPGWKDRTPEVPGMLQYWLDRTVRTVRPAAVAAVMNLWPADLLAQLLGEPDAAADVSARDVPKTGSANGVIVSLRDRRAASPAARSARRRARL